MRFTRDSSLSMLPFNDLFYEATIGRPLRLQKTDRGNGIIYCAVDWTRLEPMALWGGGGGVPVGEGWREMGSVNQCETRKLVDRSHCAEPLRTVKGQQV